MTWNKKNALDKISKPTVVKVGKAPNSPKAPGSQGEKLMKTALTSFKKAGK